MVVEGCCAECALKKGLGGAKGLLSAGARGLLLDLQGIHIRHQKKGVLHAMHCTAEACSSCRLLDEPQLPQSRATEVWGG